MAEMNLSKIVEFSSENHVENTPRECDNFF
jgi:hypothetical protein